MENHCPFDRGPGFPTFATLEANLAFILKLFPAMGSGIGDIGQGFDAPSVNFPFVLKGTKQILKVFLPGNKVGRHFSPPQALLVF